MLKVTTFLALSSNLTAKEVSDCVQPIQIPDDMLWTVDEPVSRMSDKDQVASIASKYDEIVGLKYCLNSYGILTFVQAIIAPAYNDEWYFMQKDYLDGFGTEEGMDCQEWPVSS
jgi:hypothetical protein